MDAFKLALSYSNAIVEWIPIMADEEKAGITCASKSQLMRMFGFSNANVKENDIIVTTDVDAFVMSSKIFDPLDIDQMSACK